MAPKLIVVVGATGQQGGSVVNFLLKEPTGLFSIRGITRDTSSPASQALIARGVSMVQADLSSLEQTVAAFQGADAVFGVTQFYEHGFDKEQLHGTNIVNACVAAKVPHLIWSTVEGREGECAAISWKSKALIEDKIQAAGIPCTYVYIPMYYENFWTAFFAPTWDEEKGVVWGVGFLPDAPIFAMSAEDFGGWVVPALREPEKYIGQKIKIAVEYLSLRDMGTQFTEVTGEKAGLAFEMTREQFEQSRYADHPAAEFMYLSWEYVLRAGPDSGVRDKKQTLEIYPQARTYREWLKTSTLPKEVVARIKAEAKERARVAQ